MDKVYLTPEDRAELDPTGACYRAFKQRFPNRESFEQLSPLIRLNPDEALSEYWAIFHSAREEASCHAPILKYDAEMRSKYGRQGGSYPVSTLYANLDESYRLAGDPKSTHEVLDVGLKYLLRYLNQVKARVGLPQPSYEWFIKNTSGGLPLKERKTSWSAHVTCAASWLHPLPDLPNKRRMRGKDRVTHEDATVNVDYINPALTAVRRWLITYLPSLFPGWLNPVYGVYPIISRGIITRRTALETDYKSADTHFSWFLVQHYILPIYECLLMPGEYLHFAAFVEELFSQPVYCGDFMLTGLHNLFSGQSITQDFETLYDVVLYIGAALTAGIPDVKIQNHLCAVGDDVIFFADSESLAERVYDNVRSATSAVGMILSEEKTRIQADEARFCRQVYYPQLKRYYGPAGEYMLPAYPPVLALNNIVQPENLLSPPLELASDLARLDNCRGFYRFNDFLNFVFSRIKKEYRREIDAQAVQEVNLRDWWTYLYGEASFSLDSPSVIAWRRFISAK